MSTNTSVGTMMVDVMHETNPLIFVNINLVAIPGLIAGALSLIFCVYLYKIMIAKPTGASIGSQKLDDLALKVKSGAKAFLREEYKYLTLFVAFLTAVLAVLYIVVDSTDGPGNTQLGSTQTRSWKVAVCFVVGALLSGSAGWLGMMVATDGNSRTTVACKAGTLNDGLQVAFTTGAVMGFVVVGLGLAGLSAMTLLVMAGDAEWSYAKQALSGFGFGASSIALFARVAGGIYTKAADVGADLVGKVEAGIDEDDPHNPAVIADNVGDNVGDVAGMGADLFESYVGSIIAAATLGLEPADVALPFWLSAAGIVCAIIGYFFVSTKEEGKGWDVKLSSLMWALEKGMYVAALLFIGCAALIVVMLYGENGVRTWRIFGAVLLGLFSGALIGKCTEYFTSFDYGPVISIKDRGVTGPATVVIQGLGVGMISCVPPTIILVACILGCDELDKGGRGVAIAAVGMLATLGITLATDAYGPVADNAGGLAEMAGFPPEVRNKTDSLDALGNTTAATGKGFAIGSAVLTSLSLLAAFKGTLDQNMTFDVSEPIVLSGLLFGAMLPFLFAALTMISVGKAAAEIINEVRHQFRNKKNVHGVRLMDAIRSATKLAEDKEAGLVPMDTELAPELDVEPDSDKCVQISTRSSVREMVAPGSYAVLAPVTIGFLVGPRCLMGVLAGAIVSGCMMGIMMSNAGGAWDNGKKLCEKEKIKKTDQGKACVVGDTVGDPFKDTSGPALNILIKLMSMVSLTIAPLLKKRTEDWTDFGYGFIPLGLFFLISIVLKFMEILTWKDPIGQTINASQKERDEEATADATAVKTAATPVPVDAPAAEQAPAPVAPAAAEAAPAAPAVGAEDDMGTVPS